MKFKSRFFPLLFISILFTSCFNGLKTPKETKVSFRLDEATVNKIVQNAKTGRKASRVADFDTADFFIDVTLCGDSEQTKTAPLTDEVKIDFDDVLVNSRVYAKAQVYKYLDSEKTSKEVIYSGQSETIVVRDRENVLSIKMGTATLTVTFESNGGSEIPQQSVITGQTAKEPESPVKPVDKKQYSRENYAFAGWYTDEALTKPYNFNLPVKDDLTLYAAWLPDFVFVKGTTVYDYLTAGRSVRVSDLFVSDHEVTQEEYQAVTGTNPSSFSGAENLPVENVTWFQALAYCNLLSIKEDLDPCYKINDSTDPAEWGTPTAATAVSCSISANGYRLPTESEWEYVASKATRTNKPITDLAYISTNSNGRTHPVKYSLADELCLCDIYGNVAEWCFDVYSDSVSRNAGPTGPNSIAGTVNKRVVRGGSYNSPDYLCTSSIRDCANPTNASGTVGFRVVRSAVNEYTVIKDTVTFISNGGSSVASQVINDGDTATQPANPTRTGYTFKGWQFDGAEFDFATPVMQDITLEAVWKPITYKLRFNPGDSTSTVVMNDQELTYDTDQTINANAYDANTGMRFAGWALTSGGNVTYSNEQSVKNLTTEQDAVINLYAIWIDMDACLITYHNANFDGVTNSNQTSFLISHNVTLSALSRDYYDFVGWFINDTGSAITGWNSGDYSTDLDIYARWTPVEYTITYELEGGEWVTTPDSTYNIEDSVTLPSTSSQLKKTGYNFAGWYLSTEYNSTDKITAWNAGDRHDPITIYAKWTPGSANYTVKHYFQPLNGSTNTDVYEIDDDLTQSGIAGITGQTTAATAQNITGFTNQTIVQQTIAADSSTVVNIYYNRKSITYTFTRNTTSNETWASSTDTGTSVTRTGLFGTSVTPPGVERTGYTFSSWSSSGTPLGTSPTFGAENKTYTATWNTDTYTLTAYLNGGQISGSTTYTHSCSILDSTFTLPTPTRDGFTFAGWYASSDFSTSQLTSIDFTNALNLKPWEIYAKWTYKITFDTNGGSTVAAQTLDDGQGGTAPTPPTKTGFEFDGWYTLPSFAASSAYIFGPASEDGNITLYAKWKYIVTFESNGGSSVDEQVVAEGAAPTQPTAPTKEGYTFGGWYSNSGLTTAYTFGSASTTGSFTLYAKWNYTVTYKNGTTTVKTETFAEGEATTRTTYIPTKTNYAFDDWYTTSSLTTKYTFGNVSADGDVTVYARFFNTIYVKDGGTSTADGTRSTAPMDTINSAVSKIIDTNKKIDWIIQISGMVKGTQKVESTLTTDYATSLTIQGEDHDNDILNADIGDTAQSGGSVLSIQTAVPVTIKDLQITGGNTTGNGGGILIYNVANVTLNGVRITGNTSLQSGGGIYVNGDSTSLGKLTILEGEIINNISNQESESEYYGGGGIYNKGIVVMKGGSISGNRAYCAGGGVYNDGSSTLARFYMSGNAIIGAIPGNTTDFAVYNYNEYPNLTYSLTSNYESMGQSNYVKWQTVDNGGKGGGVFNKNGIFKLGYTYDMTNGTESTEFLQLGIYYNYAYQGGGIYNKGGTEDSIVEMNSGFISNNGAYFGGGIYNVAGSAEYPTSFNMNGGTIENNRVHRNGLTGAVRGGAVSLYASSTTGGYSVFRMGGNAYVPKGVNNYIDFEGDYNTLYVTITGELTYPSPVENSMIETSNDSYYTTGRPVLYNGGVTNAVFQSAISRFEVNKSGVTIDNTGKLQN